MDRFIEIDGLGLYLHFNYLKSNMDRFIVSVKATSHKSKVNLKSNMDRFIEKPVGVAYISSTLFKIQYG